MTTQLTPSQKRAFEKLDFFFNIGLNGIGAIEGISPRPIPLIVGPSGSGKTHLVGKMAETYGLAFYSINIPNWIVRGARNESQITMVQLREFIESNDQGVILVDEVNKLTNSHLGDSAWSADIFTESIAFLDRDERLDAMGLSGLVEKLRRNFIIVGAAAFQDEWRESQQRDTAIGFVAEAQSSLDQEECYEAAIRSQNTIPEELLFRFNDRLIVILPPTEDEYGKRIASLRAALLMPELGETELDALAATAVNSGKSMRWLEGYLTECLSQLPKETLKMLAQTPFDGVAATEKSKVKAKDSPKLDQKKMIALRDECFTHYEESLKGLSQCSRRLHLLLQTVFAGHKYRVNSSKRDPLCESVRIMGELIQPDETTENQYGVVPKGLNYLADKCLLGGSSVKSDTERGEIATNVRRISCKIAGLLPILLAQCGDTSEEIAIREQALGFVVHAESICTHLIELQAIDSINKRKKGN